ncbi:MAG TPA: D-isomer specific 2-hydroxyacid dehydrogenase family protein [Lachnospiraceae bacterium]|nr:D-isomer specific 2-hydroxyacid dehydrogenase family protein [Lachnospiraceae bacterium]
MRVLVYNYREFDEKIWFDKYSEELGIELKICREAPQLGQNIDLAHGCDCLSIITSKIPADMVQAFYDQGIRYISTRTIGYDHIDLHKAGELGMKIGNAVYGPQGVADYTIMLMLMCIRKMKRIMQRAEIQDFSLQGIQGRELQDLTIGVIGTGRIGREVIRYLSGFGCKLQAYDLYENEEVKKYAEYVELDKLLRTSDMITLHMPLTDDNFHLINRDSILAMKDQVVIINTARGGLIDSAALIEGIESGKIGAAGLDVVEKEFGLYYNNLKSEILHNQELAVLRSFPNVIVTPHMAFYTDNAIASMVKNSLTSCKCFINGEDNPWEVI